MKWQVSNEKKKILLYNKYHVVRVSSHYDVAVFHSLLFIYLN